MKPTIAAITLLMAVTICSFAVAQKDSSRPAGVPASQWVPLGDRLGIVISDYQPSEALETPQMLAPRPPPPPGQDAGIVGRNPPKDIASLSPLKEGARPYIDGYFMVKQNGRWTRLSVVPPPQVLRSAE